MDANIVSGFIVGMGGFVLALTSYLSNRSKQQREEIRELSKEVDGLRSENLKVRRRNYQLETALVTNGIEPPADPIEANKETA